MSYAVEPEHYCPTLSGRILRVNPIKRTANDRPIEHTIDFEYRTISNRFELFRITCSRQLLGARTEALTRAIRRHLERLQIIQDFRFCLQTVRSANRVFTKYGLLNTHASTLIELQVQFGQRK